MLKSVRVMILVSAWWATSAGALTLPAIEPFQEPTLPIDTAEPNIPCDKILERLEAYEQMANEHHIGVSNFLYHVANRVQQWHTVFKPLEGQPNALPAGVFNPLLTGVNTINDVANVSLDNSGLLANEMDRIKMSLKDCALTPK